jgi:hypothetical protein
VTCVTGCERIGYGAWRLRLGDALKLPPAPEIGLELRTWVDNCELYVWLLLPASRSELRGNSRVVPASLDSEAVLAQESKRSAPHSEANLVLGLQERGLFSPAFWRALLE